MATFLDIGLLDSFQIIFTFLFVFVTSYAILNKVNFPKDAKGLQSLVAFILAAFTAMSGNVAKLIATMAPWFIIMFMLIMFLLIANMMFGMSPDYIKKHVEDESVITTWILVITGIIVLVSFSTVYGDTFLGFTQNSSSSATSDVGHNIGAAIFSPKMLGLILVMLIGVFTILFLSKSDKG